MTKDYEVLNELTSKTQELHRAIFDKGYEQGKADVLDKIRAEIFNACSDKYHMPVYTLSCDEIFEIIDNYREEVTK